MTVATETAQDARPVTAEDPILLVNNIEVIYDSVILVLKGVSLEVPKGSIVAILGANGAGKTTTLKAISNLLRAERGDVTKGEIRFEGQRIEKLSANDMVKRGCIQVMEGRHCFEHLTVEENLLTGAYTRTDGSSAINDSLEMVYEYFPRLKERRRSLAGYTSGGEQQMCAIGRGLMSRPRLLMIDELSLGLAPALVERLNDALLEINRTGLTILIVEQDVLTAFEIARHAFVIETGRVSMSGTTEVLGNDPRIRKAYMGL